MIVVGTGLDHFQDVILPFDARAAYRFAAIVADRESLGHASRNASLATRNTGDFISTGIEVVNPWREPGR